jgi:hypothetical protein
VAKYLVYNNRLCFRPLIFAVSAAVRPLEARIIMAVFSTALLLKVKNHLNPDGLKPIPPVEGEKI